MSPFFTRVSSLDIHENIARLVPSLQNRTVTAGNSKDPFQRIQQILSRLSLRIMVSCLGGVLTEIWHSAGKEKSCIVSAGLVWPATPTEGSCFRLPTHHTTVAKAWTYPWDPEMGPKRVQFCMTKETLKEFGLWLTGNKTASGLLPLTHNRLCRSPCMSWN